MKYYWKNGFYIDEIHFELDPETGEYTIPAGYAEITEELYHNLLDGQAAGKRIVTNADGLPELAASPQRQRRSGAGVGSGALGSLLSGQGRNRSRSRCRRAGSDQSCTGCGERASLYHSRTERRSRSCNSEGVGHVQ